MTDPRTARAMRNQEASVAAFLKHKFEFDALLAALQSASDNHFDTDPEAVLWGEAVWMAEAVKTLKTITDAHFKRGEHAA